MKINLLEITSKEMLFQRVREHLNNNGYQISREDENRPWGGFFVIDENQTMQFIEQYFKDINKDDINQGQKLSPKILLVAPKKRLSWQYHFRRSEVWSVEAGEVGVVRSLTDEENEMEQFKKGEWLKLEKGERHRLIGLDDWAIVAEIWQHTDIHNPSDENDIVRLQDDFGR